MEESGLPYGLTHIHVCRLLLTWKWKKCCSPAPANGPGSKYGTPHDWPCCCDVQDGPVEDPGTDSLTANGVGGPAVKGHPLAAGRLFLDAKPHVEGRLQHVYHRPDLSFPPDCDSDKV